jgi:serine/threonine protein kinase
MVLDKKYKINKIFIKETEYIQENEYIQYKTYDNITFSNIIFNSNNSIIYSDIDDKYILKEYKSVITKKDYIKSEIQVLKDLSEFNKDTIIKLITSSADLDSNTHSLLFHKFGIDLYEYTLHNKLSVVNIIYIINTLFETISFIHSLNIAHSDIKLENILIKDGLIKLCDFGYATYMNDQSKIFVRKGTRDYISPELYNKNEADGRLNDLWSIGIFICIMITGTHPYSQTIYNINRCKKTSNSKFIYTEDSDFWDIYNISINKMMGSSSHLFLYKYNLRKLLNVLLIKDEAVKYSTIIEYSNLDSDIKQTHGNINLCDILFNNHIYFKDTYIIN